jgi:hypothetical protein
MNPDLIDYCLVCNKLIGADDDPLLNHVYVFVEDNAVWQIHGTCMRPGDWTRWRAFQAKRVESRLR